MFLDFIENKTDNLDPEGLDMLLYDYYNEEIYFNPIYYNNYKYNNNLPYDYDPCEKQPN